jgi:folate-binding protein YgfZ
MPDAPTVVSLREEMGAVRVARDAIRVAGPDAVSYLQGQLSQDIAALAVGSSAYTLLLQPQGKVDAWLRVTRVADEELVLDVDGGHGEAVLARLRRFLLRTKATIEPVDWTCVAVRGPGAGSISDGVTVQWPGIEGADLIGPSIEIPDGVREVDGAELEAIRIEAGVPAMGAELTDATIPAEAGQWLIDSSVSFTKGCYTGQELVARIDSRGGNVPRRLLGLVLASDDAPAEGASVAKDGGEVGVVTSSAVSIALGRPVALAMIKRGVEPGDEVTVDGRPATVRSLPMVP